MRQYALFVHLFFAAGIASASTGSGISYQKKDSPNPELVARFEGKEITLEELEKSSPDIYSARLEVYKAQKGALDEYIRNQVLEGLAQKAGLSLDAYTKQEMEGARKKVSDKEVEAFLKSRNIPDTSKVPAEVRDQVRGLLHLQKIVTNATRSSQVELYLKRPKASPLDLKLEGEPTWGNKDAPITVVEFADFQCYYCAKARERISELKKIYGRRLRIVYKHFPLPMHPEARAASEASMCVNEQGSDKFWKFYDIIYDTQKAWTKDDYKEFARKSGADLKKFEECYDSKKYAAHIDASIAEGQRMGISSTPSFLVNSQLVKGAQPVSEFREIIEDSVN